MGPGRGLGTDSLPARPGLASEGASRGCRQEAARSESRGRGEVVGPREDALGLTLRVFVPLCLESPKASEGEGRKVGAGLPVTGGRGLIPGQSHPPGGGGGGVCVWAEPRQGAPMGRPGQARLAGVPSGGLGDWMGSGRTEAPEFRASWGCVLAGGVVAPCPENSSMGMGSVTLEHLLCGELCCGLWGCLFVWCRHCDVDTNQSSFQQKRSNIKSSSYHTRLCSELRLGAEAGPSWAGLCRPRWAGQLHWAPT